MLSTIKLSAHNNETLTTGEIMKKGDKAVYDGKMVEVIGFDNKNNLTKIKYENKSMLWVRTELLYIDPRLSNDPAIALQAVMKTHGIIMDIGLIKESEDHSYAWLEISSDYCSCLLSSDTEDAKTIKPEDIK